MTIDNKIATAAAILSAVLLIAIILLVRENNNLRRSNDRKDTIISEQNDSITHYVNKEGHIVGEKPLAVATPEDIKQAYPELVEEIRKEFDIKIKEVKAIMKAGFLAQGSGNAIINNHYHTDSLGNRYPVWELKATDGYLDFRASVLDSLHAPYHYTYGDTALTVFAGKKKGWFGKEKLFASTTFKNPNARIIGATNILVDGYKDKRWAVYIGAGYDPLLHKPTIGIFFGRALIKF